jgi:two-component system sensor histidine kinase BaeS
MKISIRRKFILSYAIVTVVTLLILSFAMDHLIKLELDRLIEAFNENGIKMHEIPRLLNGREDFLQTLRRAMLITAALAGMLAIGMGSLMAEYIIGPIKRVIAATKEIAHGHYTERVQVESRDELGELSHALNKMARSLEEHHKLKEVLVANVSHELATPLTNISGYLEALNDGVIKTPKEQKKTFKLLKEEADRLAMMVEEVRSLSLIEAPSFSLKPVKTELGKILKKAVSQMQPQIKAKKLNVSVEVEPKLPKLKLDPNRILQVVLNLLSNAVNYTSEGGSITLSLEKAKHELVLTISDTGIGIPERELPYIFERFYRTDKSRSRSSGGTGIGLAIVKELMEAHGGSVKASSQLKKGSSFTCRFPLK